MGINPEPPARAVEPVSFVNPLETATVSDWGNQSFLRVFFEGLLSLFSGDGRYEMFAATHGFRTEDTHEEARRERQELDRSNSHEPSGPRVDPHTEPGATTEAEILGRVDGSTSGAKLDAAGKLLRGHFSEAAPPPADPKTPAPTHYVMPRFGPQ